MPCKSQQVTKYASYSKDTVDLLFRVLHGMPVAPVGIEHTHIKLALDEKLLQQDQERLGIEVAARLILISTYLANLLAPIKLSFTKKNSGSAILSTKMQLVEHSPPEHTKKAKLLGSIQVHFSLL